MSVSSATQRSSGFAVIAAAMIGNMTSMNTVLVYSLGAFMAGLTKDFGWSRAEISLSITFFTLVVFLGSSLTGRLADRVDPGRLAALSMAAFGLVLMTMPYLIRSPTTLWIGYGCLALVGLGTSPTVLSKPVVALFFERRGLAIGVALVGTGLGGFIAPQLATALIAKGGWQLGYTGLGWCAVAVAPLLWVFLGKGRSAKGVLPTRYLHEQDGLSFRQAVGTRAFRLLSFLAFFVGVGTSGPTVHLIPLLLENAMTAQSAARIAALIGLSSIVGRLLTGYLLDRVNSPKVGIPLFAASAGGVVLLSVPGAASAAAGACLLGFGLGAHIDLLAYFTARYFGLGAYSTLFGWSYGMVALGASTGPVIAGALRDSTGTYTDALLISAGFIAAAAALSFLLEPYRFAAHTTRSEMAASERDPAVR